MHVRLSKNSNISLNPLRAANNIGLNPSAFDSRSNDDVETLGWDASLGAASASASAARRRQRAEDARASVDAFASTLPRSHLSQISVIHVGLIMDHGHVQARVPVRVLRRRVRARG